MWTYFNESIVDFLVWTAGKESLSRGKLSPLSETNGFAYQQEPQAMAPLYPVNERLFSPRRPFAHICRLSTSAFPNETIDETQRMVRVE
jgi:hypothetical protein